MNLLKIVSKLLKIVTNNLGGGSVIKNLGLKSLLSL